MVYLPTLMVDFYGKCRKVLHGFYGIDTWNSISMVSPLPRMVRPLLCTSAEFPVVAGVVVEV